MLFDQPNPAQSNRSRFMPGAGSLLNYVAIVALMSASTAVMMLCPCDSVGIRDPYAISLVALAVFFGLAAAFLIYRRMKQDSGITPFLRAVVAIAIAGFGVFVELFAAMRIVAWLARPR